MPKDERITVRLPLELKIKVEELAKSLNTSTNDVIKFIVFDYFE